MIKRIAAIFAALFFSLCLYPAEFYWEAPKAITDTDSRFLSAVSGDTVSAFFWEEIGFDTDNNRVIWISSYATRDGKEWVRSERFAGPFAFSGEIPNIYTAAVNSAGTLAVAVQAEQDTVRVYASHDGGRSYRSTELPGTAASVVAPRIFSCSGGDFMLFCSSGDQYSFRLNCTRSADGLRWQQPVQFEPARGMHNPFLPYIVSWDSYDMCIFQAAYNNGSYYSYQLYAAVSRDNGASWTQPELLTDTDPETFTLYENQRPQAVYCNGNIHLVWERSPYTSTAASVWYAVLDTAGRIDAASVQQLSKAAAAYAPSVFVHNGALYALWTDNSLGYDSVMLADTDAYFWTAQSVSPSERQAAFACRLRTGNTLVLAWQQEVRADGESRIMQLFTDSSVSAPEIIPQGFYPGQRMAQDTVSAQVRLPADSSGIAGYSWIWTDDPEQEPPKQIQRLPDNVLLEGQAQTDGSWYFKAAACDYAGNWSESACIEFVRDTTPPDRLVLHEVPVDGGGTLYANTFAAAWDAPAAADVAGYTWTLEYLSPVPQIISGSVNHPCTLPEQEIRRIAAEAAAAAQQSAAPVLLPQRIQGTEPQASFQNRINGVYRFSAAAVDTAGNIGVPASQLLVLNKYAPRTVITRFDSTTDIYGTVSLRLFGEGYTYDGYISEIYIDSDGQAPYDMTLRRSSDDYLIQSDSIIERITCADLDEGVYRIGLLHTDRGLYFTEPILNIKNYGTVKTGDYSLAAADTERRGFHAGFFDADGFMLPGILTACVLFLCAAAGIVMAAHGIYAAVRQGRRIRLEIRAILTGDDMSFIKKQAARFVRSGISLKYKLVSFTVFLVVVIILLVSVPLGIFIIRTQEQVLAEGLHDRIMVMLNSLSSGVRAYMPTKNALELGFLPQQVSQFREAQYATILGRSASPNKSGIQYVWATNDLNIGSKIAGDQLILGESVLSNETVDTIARLCEYADAQTTELVRGIAANITALNAEGVAIAMNSDAASVRRFAEIQSITVQLNEQLTEILDEQALKTGGSIPQFSTDELDYEYTRYLFYRPVLYRQGSSESYVQGIVLVEISTEELINTVIHARNNVIFIISIIACITIALGLTGSLILASIIVRPIQYLAAHVAMIRDTPDKENLEGKDIQIRSKDEIGLLGDTVNDMTHGLIKAAAAAKELTVGKEVQKMFIPLETDSRGQKLSTGHLHDNNADIFGYYEGAQGVSGDYFDAKKLDNRWYAIIKCDVAGKGVSAALIMVEVATLFQNFFYNWQYTNTASSNLIQLASRINDQIESHGFTGRFAAFTLCLFDSASGTLYFCNAGDNQIHLYDAAQQKYRTITLPETAAAGVFPSDVIMSNGGFKVASIQMRKKDVIFLYTDGIEEAKRFFRDSAGNIITCTERNAEGSPMHGNHMTGADSEDFSEARISGIIEAVFARAKYRLHKDHDATPDDELIFDFSSCSGTPEEAVMALVAVEKIFRMYRTKTATRLDIVRIDKKIDAFLRKHFTRYADYCMKEAETDSVENYITYSGVCEEPQYDDLTIMSFQKK